VLVRCVWVKKQQHTTTKKQKNNNNNINQNQPHYHYHSDKQLKTIIHPTTRWRARAKRGRHTTHNNRHATHTHKAKKNGWASTEPQAGDRPTATLVSRQATGHISERSGSSAVRCPTGRQLCTEPLEYRNQRLVLGRLLLQERLVDVRDHAAARNRRLRKGAWWFG